VKSRRKKKIEKRRKGIKNKCKIRTPKMTICAARKLLMPKRELPKESSVITLQLQSNLLKEQTRVFPA